MYNSFYDNPTDYEDSDYESLVQTLVDMARGNPHGDLDRIVERIQELYEDGELDSRQYANLMDLAEEA